METQEQPGVLREGSELLQGKEQEAAILRKELQLCPYLGERKSSQEGCMYCLLSWETLPQRGESQP